MCSSELLAPLLGMTAVEAMAHIGFDLEWLAARLEDGTEHLLVLLPAADGQVATWDNVWSLIREHFGEKCHAALLPFREEIEALPDYASFDPTGAIQRLAN